MEQKSKDTFYLDPDYENFVPRKTRLKYSTVGYGFFAPLFLLIIGCIAGVFAFILAVGVYDNLRVYWQYKVNGLETTATITSCELLEDSSRANDLSVTFVYTVNNTDYIAHHIVAKRYAHCGQFLTGTQVDILYKADNPTHSQMAESTPFFSVAILTPLVICVIPMFLFLFGFGIYCVVIEIYARYKYHYLRKSSVVLEGEVVKSEYKTGQSKRGEYYVLNVTSEFETPDGRVLTQTFRGNPEDSTSRAIPPAGTRVMLLYANDRAVIML